MCMLNISHRGGTHRPLPLLTENNRRPRSAPPVIVQVLAAAHPDAHRRDAPLSSPPPARASPSLARATPHRQSRAPSPSPSPAPPPRLAPHATPIRAGLRSSDRPSCVLGLNPSRRATLLAEPQAEPQAKRQQRQRARGAPRAHWRARARGRAARVCGATSLRADRLRGAE